MVIDSMKKQIESVHYQHQEQNNSLSSENKKLKQTINDLEKDVKRMRTDMSGEEKQNVKYKLTIESFELKISTLNMEISTLR